MNNKYLDSTQMEELTGTPASTWRYWAPGRVRARDEAAVASRCRAAQIGPAHRRALAGGGRVSDALVGRGKLIAERLNALTNDSKVPGSRNRDTELGTDVVPGSLPPIREPGTDAEKPLYVDICALLDGTLRNRPHRFCCGAAMVTPSSTQAK